MYSYFHSCTLGTTVQVALAWEGIAIQLKLMVDALELPLLGSSIGKTHYQGGRAGAEAGGTKTKKHLAWAFSHAHFVAGANPHNQKAFALYLC